MLDTESHPRDSSGFVRLSSGWTRKICSHNREEEEEEEEEELSSALLSSASGPDPVVLLGLEFADVF